MAICRLGMACERDKGPASLLIFRAILGCRWQRGTGVAPWTRGPVWNRFFLGLVLRQKPNRVCFDPLADMTTQLWAQPESSLWTLIVFDACERRRHVVELDTQPAHMAGQIRTQSAGYDGGNAWGCTFSVLAWSFHTSGPLDPGLVGIGTWTWAASKDDSAKSRQP